MAESYQHIAQELRSLRSKELALQPVQVARSAIGLLRKAIDNDALRDEPTLRALAYVKRANLDGMSADTRPNDCWNVDDDVYAWDRVADYVSDDNWKRYRKVDLGRMQSWLEACEPVAKMIECSVPQDAAGALQPDGKGGKEATHSPDFRSVNWFGSEYSFTPNQAAIVKVLWGCWKNNAPDVGNPTLLEAADCNSERLDLVFREHPAWDSMIIAGKTKGTRRLSEPKP